MEREERKKMYEAEELPFMPGDEKKVRLYEVITQGSLNAGGQEALADSSFTTYNIKEPVCKTLIADFEIDLGL